MVDPALVEPPAARRLMARHAVLYAGPADGERRLLAAVLAQHDPSCLVFVGSALPEVVPRGVADQAVDRVFRILSRAPDVADVVSRMAGVAPGEPGLSRLRAGRGLLPGVLDVVSVAP